MDHFTDGYSSYQSPKDLLHQLVKDIPITVVEKRDLIMPNDTGKQAVVGYLEEGKGEIVLFDEDERDLLIGFVHPGDFVGEGTALIGEDMDTRIMLIKARTTCHMRYIPLPQFLQLAGTKWQFAALVMRQMAMRQRQLTRILARIQFYDVLNRVRGALEDLTADRDAVSHPLGWQIRITRQDIGRMVGCSRESAGRAISHLCRIGAMEARGMNMVVYRTPGIALPLL